MCYINPFFFLPETGLISHLPMNQKQIHSKIGDISQKIMSDQGLQALKMNPCFPIPQYISVNTRNKKTVEY